MTTVMEVTCSRCGAQPHSACMNGGAPITGGCHSERHEAAWDR